MQNAFDELTAALSIAQDVRRASERHAEKMARLLNEPGVLESVSHYELEKLKRALVRFNMQSGRWRKAK